MTELSELQSMLSMKFLPVAGRKVSCHQWCSYWDLL